MSMEMPIGRVRAAVPSDAELLSRAFDGFADGVRQHVEATAALAAAMEIAWSVVGLARRDHRFYGLTRRRWKRERRRLNAERRTSRGRLGWREYVEGGLS